MESELAFPCGIPGLKVTQELVLTFHLNCKKRQNKSLCEVDLSIFSINSPIPVYCEASNPASSPGVL